MKNAKHTPAPWRVIEADFHPGDHVADMSNGLMVVAISNLGDPLADALLIAAAPDLLAALHQMLVAYQGKKQGVWGESTKAVIDARAAIAKATGEAA